MRALSYDQLTLTAATGLTPPAGASMAWLQAESANIRYKLNGQDPTAASGLIMRSTEPPIEIQTDLYAVRVIQESAGSKLNIIYFG